MIPIKSFYDHGPTAEPDREQVPGFQKAYADIHAKAKHTVLKAGDKIPFAGVDWLVVISAMQPIKAPIKGAPGAGTPNPACATFQPKNTTGDPENGYSVGSVITFGRFRTIDLGDLLWDREFDLMCPTNRLGHDRSIPHHAPRLQSLGVGSAGAPAAQPGGGCEQRHSQRRLR